MLGFYKDIFEKELMMNEVSGEKTDTVNDNSNDRVTIKELLSNIWDKINSEDQEEIQALIDRKDEIEAEDEAEHEIEIEDKNNPKDISENIKNVKDIQQNVLNATLLLDKLEKL